MTSRLVRVISARVALFGCCALALIVRPRVRVAWGADTPAAEKAPPAVDSEVVVLYATNAADAGRSKDPRIDPHLPLDQPPFSAYASYKLVSRSPLSLKKGVPSVSVLPNGRTLELVLRDVPSSGRYRIATRILEANGAVFLPMFEVTAAAGEPIFVAGQTYESGVLFVGTMLR